MLVNQVTVFLITSGLSGIIFNALNIPDIWRRLIIWWSYSRKENESQRDGSEISEKADYYFPTFQIILNKAY